MIYLSRLKDQLVQAFRFMTETDTNYIDVSWRGRLYRLYVEDLHQETVQRRRPRRVDLSGKVTSEKCPTCKKLMLNGVCMSSICPSNRVASLSSGRQ